MIPWKLIFFLIILTLVILFAGFNVANTVDISLGFKTFEEVPIFIALFIAFILGNFVMLPFALGKNRRTKKAKAAKAREKLEKQEKKEAKKRRKGKKDTDESAENPILPEGDPFRSDTSRDEDS
jgi:uncharacterized integral membrane protein